MFCFFSLQKTFISFWNLSDSEILLITLNALALIAAASPESVPVGPRRNFGVAGASGIGRDILRARFGMKKYPYIRVLPANQGVAAASSVQTLCTHFVQVSAYEQELQSC